MFSFGCYPRRKGGGGGVSAFEHIEHGNREHRLVSPLPPLQKNQNLTWRVVPSPRVNIWLIVNDNAEFIEILVAITSSFDGTVQELIRGFAHYIYICLT